MKLGIKIGLGFGAVVAIAVVLGGVGYVGAMKYNASVTELGRDQLPSVESLEAIQYRLEEVTGLKKTLLLSGLSAETIAEQYAQIAKVRAAYGESWQTFDKIPKDSEEATRWQALGARWQDLKKSNDEFFALAHERDALGLGDLSKLQTEIAQVERDHYRLANRLFEAIQLQKNFEGGEDATACLLGHMLANDALTGKEGKEILSRIAEPHRRFHEQAGRIKRLAVAGDPVAAMSIYEEEMAPTMTEVFGELTKLSELVAHGSTLEDQMIDHVMVTGRPVHEDVVKRLDELVEDNVSDANIETETSIKSAETAKWTVLIATLIGAVVASIVAYFITIGITRPMRTGVSFSERMAEGDLTQTLQTNRNDEIGQLTSSMNRMAEGLRSNMTQVAENAHALGAASHELSAVSTQVSSNSEETSSQANVVASAAEQVSKSVASVATSADEMSAAIKEVAQQASEAAKVASRAAEVAERTNTTIVKLGDSSAEIGNVIKVITSIAEQTNLLALNATIEAARAGEAGKGFAVVANEVKELAKQTARATEEIRAKIEGIQGETTGAVTAIKEIAEVIQQINQIQTVIASSVEEQAATMNEISKNSTEASRGSAEIAQNISSVSQAAKSSTEAAANTAASATELSRLAAQMNTIVAQFKLDNGSPAATSAAEHSASAAPAHSNAYSAAGGRKARERSKTVAA